MTGRPPSWLIERYGTLDAALLAADLAVVDAEVDVGAKTRVSWAALERMQAVHAEWEVLDSERRVAYDRLINVRKHRDWVERLLCPPEQPLDKN